MQRVYESSKGFRDFADREQVDQVALCVCGRDGRSVSAPALLTWVFWVILDINRAFGLSLLLRHPDWKGIRQHFNLTQSDK